MFRSLKRSSPKFIHVGRVSHRQLSCLPMCKPSLMAQEAQSGFQGCCYPVVTSLAGTRAIREGGDAFSFDLKLNLGIPILSGVLLNEYQHLEIVFI